MRSAGILLHISSLPSPHGIGTLGKKAYDFVDFLEASHQTLWQVLPVCPTSFGDSPYQSPSAFAGNPYFIDLDILCKQGLLKESEIENYYFGHNAGRIDYAKLFDNRYPLLRKAFARFSPTEEYIKFKEKNSFWLNDFALFMAVKEYHHYNCWLYWDEPIRMRERTAVEEYSQLLARTMEFYEFLQFCFYEQWHKLKKYANSKGIKIIGDMPIYVALDSSEVWTDSKRFVLDENHIPTAVAGCPPDAFSEKGQLWGNPLYDWNIMREEDYAWWIKRIQHSSELFDMIRIDHFRGFESYYTIPYGNEDATVGEWRKGPGMDLFNALRSALGDMNIIAEDLGFLTPEVHEMLRQSGYPGMKVLQFGFCPDEDSIYLPHNYPKNCVAYTGTHDNDTMRGWYQTANERERDFAKLYVGAEREKDFSGSCIKAAMMSAADTVVIPMQDYLNLDGEARMNTPSTLGGNWMFRLTEDMLTKELSEHISALTKVYKRV